MAWTRYPDRIQRSNPRSPRRPYRRTDSPEYSQHSVAGDESQSGVSSDIWQAASVRPHERAKENLHKLLKNDVLVVTRFVLVIVRSSAITSRLVHSQLEMLNIFIGFEQTNKYAINTENGEVLGHILEEPRGFLSTFSRQIFRTHRPFNAIVMDLDGSPMLWVRLLSSDRVASS